MSRGIIKISLLLFSPHTSTSKGREASSYFFAATLSLLRWHTFFLLSIYYIFKRPTINFYAKANILYKVYIIIRCVIVIFVVDRSEKRRRKRFHMIAFFFSLCSRGIQFRAKYNFKLISSHCWRTHSDACSYSQRP